MYPIDTSNTGVAFNVVATVDTTDGEGNTVPAGTVVNSIIGQPDGSGGIIGWTPPPGFHVVQVTAGGN